MLSDLTICVRKWSKIACADFALQNMVETTLPDGLETSGQGCIANFGIFLDIFEFLRFGWFFFRFPKKMGFWAFLVHPTVVSVLLSASVERCFVSRMRDFQRIGPWPILS